MTDPRRAIPSVERLLASAPFARLLDELPRELVVARLQAELGLIRESPAQPAAGPAGPAASWLAERVERDVRRLQAGTLVPVLNATGVVLHTNLGRAPLPAAALAAIQRAAHGYSNLEYDLADGGRGSRYDHCRELLIHLTGAEDALVVNNNAAAVVLALNTMADGRDAIISRGELVEIGGSFRVPDIMARSGALLREVGSTNRTRAEDYREALSPRAGAILKVHPANFTMTGYTADVPVAELAGIARLGGVPLIHDVGSGLLLDPALLGLPDEPAPAASLRDGADIVTLSGDKLLGGPQCGIVLGRSAPVARMRANPLCRAVRVDKLTLAALNATLGLYLDPQRALREVPVLRMLTAAPAELESRARALSSSITGAGVAARTMPGHSAVGGGAAPGAALVTTLVAVHAGGTTAQQLQRRLRAGDPPVIARIVDDVLVLDPRTVPEDAADRLVQAVLLACGAGSGSAA
jgi:L-seryl-tRNA(Ser) seleniumtransferase